MNFFFPLEETGREICRVTQFLIPSRMLAFESSNDACVSLQQDQQAAHGEQGGWKPHDVFKGRLVLSLFGDYLVCKEFGTVCVRWLCTCCSPRRLAGHRVVLVGALRTLAAVSPRRCGSPGWAD